MTRGPRWTETGREASEKANPTKKHERCAAAECAWGRVAERWAAERPWVLLVGVSRHCDINSAGGIPRAAYGSAVNEVAGGVPSAGDGLGRVGAERNDLVGTVHVDHARPEVADLGVAH